MEKNDEDNRRLRASLNASSQKVTVRQITKRLPRTPLSSVNKFLVRETPIGFHENVSSVSNESTHLDVSSSSSLTGVPSFNSTTTSHVSARSRLNFSGVSFSDESANAQLSRPVLEVKETEVMETDQQERKVTLFFRSRLYAKRFSPICKMLQQGSIRKAMKSLLGICYKEKNQNAALGIGDFVSNEVKLIQKNCSDVFKGSKIDDFRRVDLDSMVSTAKTTSPLLWSILAAAIGLKPNSNSMKQQNHLLAAFSILLHGRCQQLSTFQYLVSLSLYENNLDKDGYAALNSLGMSVSYWSLQNKLTSVREHGQLTVRSWKESMERQEKEQNKTVDHLYCKIDDARRDTSLPMFHEYASQSVAESTEVLEPGYRLNLDNLDYYVRVRNVTEEHQNQLNHYVQMMAIRDRVNCEHLPNDKPIGDLMLLDNSAFIPDQADLNTLRQDIIQVVSWVACKHLPALASFQEFTSDRFTHKFSDEMEKKSTVIPLGILDKSEQSSSELIEVLQYLHQLVPGTKTEEELQLMDNKREENSKCMRSLLLGGDQMTVKLIRSAHAALANGNTADDRLEGLVGMVEDFHEKITFLQVIVNKFYKDKSATDNGTLSNLRYLINRKNVTSEAIKAVKKDYHAISDFIDTATDSHIIALVMNALQLEKIDGKSELIMNETEACSVEDKKQWLTNFIGNIVDTHIMNALSVILERTSDLEQNLRDDACDDGIYGYATDFLKFGLLRRVNIMATRAGDGIRLIRHWKFALLVYYGHHHTNYQLEAFLMLASVRALLTPRLSHQLTWNRFVNLSGGSNSNLEGDYVMELLVRSAKNRIKTLGPNHAPIKYSQQDRSSCLILP